MLYKEIFLPIDLKWEKLDTGVSHIDSTRMQINTDFFISDENILVYGDAPIQYYTDIDSISIVYEAGIIEYRYLDCLKLEKNINDTLIIFGNPLYFESGDELAYSNTTCIPTKKMFSSTIKDLATEIMGEIEACKK